MVSESIMLGTKGWFYFNFKHSKGLFFNDPEVGTCFLPALLFFKVAFSSKSLL